VLPSQVIWACSEAALASRPSVTRWRRFFMGNGDGA
jgi:hypothetical protein